MFPPSAILVIFFICGLKATFSNKFNPIVRPNNVGEPIWTQTSLIKGTPIFNNTQNMSRSTQMDYFLSDSPVIRKDAITILRNGNPDRTLYTPSKTSTEILHTDNIPDEFNISERITFDSSTPVYSRFTLGDDTHPSLPNNYQITDIVHNKLENINEASDKSNFSKTNSEQGLTTLVSINGHVSSSHFHDLTPATKVNISSSLCVVSLISKEGVIANQGYPYAYGVMEHCQWIVRLPHGPRIKVTFEDLDLEFDKDFLDISFGEEDEYYFRRYTGTKIPPVSVFDTDYMKIVFKTDQDGDGRGFYIYFEETHEAPSFALIGNPMCSELSVSKEGNLATPGYPELHYSNNEFCSWVIAAPANSVIKLEIVDFRTEIYDQLTIGLGLDAASNDSSSLIRLFGNVETPQETIIPANALWMQFRSDESVTATGFNINYEIIERHICETGKDFSSSHGVFQSENYPQEYPINSECRWTIRGDKGAHIILHFLHFQLQEGHDFLLIGQGSDEFVGNFTQFTGRIEHAKSLRMEMNNLWVHFTSDHVKGNRFYSGFKISFSIERIHADLLSDNPDTGGGNVNNVIVQKQLSKGAETTSDAMTNGRSWNTTQNTNFVVYLQGYSKIQVETKRDYLLDSLVNVFLRFCQEKQRHNCLIRNDDIQLLSIVKDTSENKVRVCFRIHSQSDKMTTSKSREFQHFLDNSNIQLHSPRLNKKTLTSSEDFVEESVALPSWLVAVIATVIFLVVLFFAMLLYSLLRSKKSRSRTGSCQMSSSEQSSNAAELEEGNAEIKITSFVGTQEKEDKPDLNNQKEIKLDYEQQEISLNTSRESVNAMTSTRSTPIDLDNQTDYVVPPSLDHTITLHSFQPDHKETDNKVLIPATKQTYPVPMENPGLCLEEVSTDL